MKFGKSKGEGQYIAFVLVLVVMLAVIVYAVNITADMERSRKISNIIREYVLKMESAGCLSAEQQQALVISLENLGMTDIVFNVNPLLQASYGEEVVLSVTGTIQVNNIMAYRNFQLVRDGNRVQITKTIKSTAQH